MSEFKCPHCGTLLSISAKPPGRKLNLEDAKSLFPSGLEELVNVTQEGNYITIKPRQFLGSDNFAKIASIVRGAGGEYVSAGKASHFRIPT